MSEDDAVVVSTNRPLYGVSWLNMRLIRVNRSSPLLQKSLLFYYYYFPSRQVSRHCHPCAPLLSANSNNKIDNNAQRHPVDAIRLVAQPVSQEHNLCRDGPATLRLEGERRRGKRRRENGLHVHSQRTGNYRRAGYGPVLLRPAAGAAYSSFDNSPRSTELRATPRFD